MTVEREGIKKAICDFDTINIFLCYGADEVGTGR